MIFFFLLLLIRPGMIARPHRLWWMVNLQSSPGNGGEGRQTKKKLITEIVRINYRASLSALAPSAQFSIQQSSVAIQIVQFMDSSLFTFVIPPFPLFFAFHSSSCEKNCGEVFLVDRWKAGSFGAIKRLDFGSVNRAVSVILVITHPIVLRRRTNWRTSCESLKRKAN